MISQPLIMQCQTHRYLSKQDIVVPCGRCAFCLATRRSDWATRLHYEAKCHLKSQFVTLTYSDNNLRWKNSVSQLDKRDLQLFFKRLRKAGYSLRYYAVGEYGSKTFRPHYHAILFGDINEDAIRKSWGLGQVHIGTVTQSSIAYTLGYIVNGKGWKMVTKRVPPFALMSRKPGLGSNYLQGYDITKDDCIASPEMVQWHQADRKNYVIIDGKKRHLPRFYKTKIFSKIDHVRIAIREQKDSFKRDVEWLRSPSMQRMADPLSYRKLQYVRAAKTIRSKTKQNLTI